jgi:ribose transport system substrate-binding protein
MFNFRNALLLASTALVLIATTGCERHSKSEVYYLVSNNLKLPYWKTVNEGFAKAGDEYHVTTLLRGPDTYDAQAEADEFKKAVAAKPAGILVSVVDASLLGPEINSAIESGIPVITLDSDAPHSERLFFIGTNNLEAGRLGGQRVVEKLKGKGNVVVFTSPGQPNLDERLKGYKDAFADQPGIKIAEIFDIKGDANAAFDRAEIDVQKTGAEKIDAFICLESGSGKAVAEVLRRHNASDRLLIGMDVDPATLQLIQEGRIDSTIAQKPYTMGYYGLKALDMVHHSLPTKFEPNYQVDTFSRYPAFIDTGTALVDKDNASIYAQSEANAAAK